MALKALRWITSPITSAARYWGSNATRDPKGFIEGAAVAYANDNTGNVVPMTVNEINRIAPSVGSWEGPEDKGGSPRAGAAFGHSFALVQGVAEMAFGGTAAVGGGAEAVVAAPTVVGSAPGIAVSGAGVAVAIHGGVTSGTALGNLVMMAVRNPYGSKGKPDHQAKVDELEDKARIEAAEGETVLRERQLQGHDSRRKPDIQIVDSEGKARKVFEAERYPNRKRNVDREAEYDKLDLDNETHGLD